MAGQAQIQLTKAEEALIDAFRNVVGDLPGDSAVTTQRDRMIFDIRSRGLPTRRVEAWHYTDLRRMLSTVPVVDPRAAAPASLPTLLKKSAVAVVANGAALHADRNIEGVRFSSVADMLADGQLAPELAVEKTDDAVGALNAAFVTDGWFLDIAPETKLDSPIELQNLHTAGQAHVRFPVRVGDGSKILIVERQTGENAALVSSISNMTVGADAEVTWIIVQQQPQDVTYLGQFAAELGANSKLKLFIVNLGGKLVRQEVKVTAAGEGADFQLRAINLLDGNSHTDITMVLGHNVPETTSTEVVRSIVFDNATGVFQGQIRVAPDAQKTDARMACNTLLLSDDADFNSKPELEIFADDVQCAHGATVADIDPKHLFYLQARGIPEERARGLLVQAFVAEIIEELDDENLVEALESLVENWLERRHG